MSQSFVKIFMFTFIYIVYVYFYTAVAELSWCNRQHMWHSHCYAMLTQYTTHCNDVTIIGQHLTAFEPCILLYYGILHISIFSISACPSGKKIYKKKTKKGREKRTLNGTLVRQSKMRIILLSNQVAKHYVFYEMTVYLWQAK